MSDVSTAMPSGTAAPDTVSGMIDAALSAPADMSDTQDAPPDLEAPTEEIADEPAVEAAPEPEPEPEPDAPTEVEPAAEAQPEPELDPTDDIEPDKVSNDGKTYFFRAAKAKALLADRQFVNNIRAKIPNATVEQLEQHYVRTVALDEALEKMDSADPVLVAEAAGWFIGGANPQSIGAFADHVVRTVASEHPQAYRKIAGKIVGGYTKSLYDAAVKSGDKGLLALAQNLDFKQRGKFMDEADFANRDPHADRAADLERREREYQARIDGERRQFVEQQFSAAKQAEETAVSEDIEKALAPVAEAFKDTPQWRHMTRDIRDSIDEAIKANPTWKRQYDAQERRVRSNPTEESKAALTTMMRQFVAPIIAKSKKAVIETHTQTVMGKAADAHRKQQQLAAKREPAGGSPVQRASLAQKVREAKTQDEVWRSIGL
ncbi:MAG TPA: hypothetical protein VN428_02365 [Bryobacteraceae bacterium]|nr:hypothetical protein [Bryobacteraceae bacterium]